MFKLSTILFENKFKYPRTPHLPWTQSLTPDDVRITSVDHFVGKEIVVTEKNGWRKYNTLY